MIHQCLKSNLWVKYWMANIQEVLREKQADITYVNMHKKSSFSPEKDNIHINFFKKTTTMSFHCYYCFHSAISNVNECNILAGVTPGILLLCVQIWFFSALCWWWTCTSFIPFIILWKKADIAMFVQIYIHASLSQSCKCILYPVHRAVHKRLHITNCNKKYQMST